MKTGVYSLLFAINFLYESGSLPPVNGLLGGSIDSKPSTTLTQAPEVPAVGVPEVPEAPTVPKLPSLCIIKSLTSSSELLLRIGILVCQYDQGLETKLNEDNFEALYKSLKVSMTNTLCAVDDVLKTHDKLQQLGTPTSEIVKTLVESLRPILDESGLSKPLMKTLCGSIAPALTPDCLPALLTSDPVKLILDMKLQACKGQNEQLFYEDAVAILQRLGCLLTSPSELPGLPSVAGPDVKEPIALIDAPPPVAGPDFNKPIALPAAPPLLVVKTSLTLFLTVIVKPVARPAVKKTLALPAVPPPVAGPDFNKPIALPAAPPIPNTTTATVPTPPLSIVKRDLGESISTPKLDVIKQGGTKDPVVMVSCIAIDLLVKQVAPV
ncbi:uncharacterized protein [Aquarana catesbeiana]|uniref:uncharacterized protein isoform X2 n=1 Tax=Aquarana catesbeiana TaxID=8400 RepID=UPI003CC9FBC0